MPKDPCGHMEIHLLSQSGSSSQIVSQKLGDHVSETTVPCLKMVNVCRWPKEKRAAQYVVDVVVLPLKKRGRPVLLWDDLNMKIQ